MKSDANGYNGAIADMWSLGATLIQALVGDNGFVRDWLPAYDGFADMSGTALRSRLSLARAYMRENVAALHSSGAPVALQGGQVATENAAGHLAPADLVEPPSLRARTDDGERIMNANLEAPHVSELARGLVLVTFACLEPEPGARPTALEVRTLVGGFERRLAVIQGADPVANNGTDREEGHGAT